MKIEKKLTKKVSKKKVTKKLTKEQEAARVERIIQRNKAAELKRRNKAAEKEKLKVAKMREIVDKDFALFADDIQAVFKKHKVKGIALFNMPKHQITGDVNSIGLSEIEKVGLFTVVSKGRV